MENRPTNIVPRVALGRTRLEVGRIGLSGLTLATPNHAREWDPFTPAGEQAAIAMVQTAIDAGINFIETAPAYGKGHADQIIGKAVAGRRDRVVLATRVPHKGGGVVAAVEASLRRLRTDYVDLAQFHAVAYKPEDARRIFNDGPLDALELLREKGKVRFIGFSVEAPATGRPLIASFRFDVMQVRYNLIDQSAAVHVLDEARQTELGVVASAVLTGGVFQHIAQALAPRWQEAHDPSDVALKFVLADSRVQVAAVAAYSEGELARYAALAGVFDPPFDAAELLRGQRPVAGCPS